MSLYLQDLPVLSGWEISNTLINTARCWNGLSGAEMPMNCSTFLPNFALAHLPHFGPKHKLCGNTCISECNQLRFIWHPRTNLLTFRSSYLRIVFRVTCFDSCSLSSHDCD